MMIDARHFFDDLDRINMACFHQYELVHHDKKENIKIYQCYWCHNQLIRFGIDYGSGLEGFIDSSKPLPGDGENFIGGLS